jgi:hypothetical protein
MIISTVTQPLCVYEINIISCVYVFNISATTVIIIITIIIIITGTPRPQPPRSA